MKRAIILRTALLSLLAVIIASIVTSFIFQTNEVNQVSDYLSETLSILIKTCQTESYSQTAKKMSEVSGGYRITIIADDGAVLADSHFNSVEMENHANRPEVIYAAKSGFGRAIRMSDTFKGYMIYVAVKSENATYRIATPIKHMYSFWVDQIPAILIGIVASLLITPLLASRFADGITKPLSDAVDSLADISNGSSTQICSPKYEELEPFVAAINSLTRSISKSMAQLNYQQQKTKYLLDNMDSGLILIDSNLRILLLNNAAKDFFEQTGEFAGKNLIHLIHAPSIISAAEKATAQNISSLFDFDLTQRTGRMLTFHITPIAGDWVNSDIKSGAVILITDSTQTKNTEKIRSEFFANASHELKTPITSIKGFSELLASGVVSDKEKVEDYLLRIRDEADRMTDMIDDILRITTLESGKNTGSLDDISLRELCIDIVKSLEPQINEKNIDISIEGDAEITAVPDDMRQLLRNLIDNAIKYNIDNGKVKITFMQSSANCSIVVSDTGIGIPKEYQSRVFERFYRVDKARSKQISGTGLGLSIVKHIVSKYNGSISLSSEVDKGTEITVAIASIN
ncbi:MAG TPA: hypothetical protein DCP97_01835 [Ruminococcaceae bacterium]|nr:hypothetical protein [Oscillospiraceae bacterium]